MDLLFSRKFFADDSGRWFDWLGKFPVYRNGRFFCVWIEVGAGTFAAVLSLGLVRVFVRGCAFTLLIFIATMSRWLTWREPSAIEPTISVSWSLPQVGGGLDPGC